MMRAYPSRPPLPPLSKPLRIPAAEWVAAATGAPIAAYLTRPAVARSEGVEQLHRALPPTPRTRGGPRVFEVSSCTALVACLPCPRWIIPWPGTRSVHTQCPSPGGWMEYKVNRHNHSGLQSTPARGTVACHSMTRSSAPFILRSHLRITPRVTQAPDSCRRTCRPPRRQPRTHVCCSAILQHCTATLHGNTGTDSSLHGFGEDKSQKRWPLTGQQPF